MNTFNHKFHPYIHTYIITLLFYSIVTAKDLLIAFLKGNPQKVWLWQNINYQIGITCLIITISLMILALHFNKNNAEALDLPIILANTPIIAAFLNISLKPVYKYYLGQSSSYQLYLEAIDVGILYSTIALIIITIISYIVIYIATFSDYKLTKITN